MAIDSAKLNFRSDMGKWYAVMVLVLIAMVIYYLFFQGFANDHSLMNEEISSLEEERKEYTELSSQIPELQSRIAQVRETMGDNTNFLNADTYNLGTAELTTLFKGIVAQNTESSTDCQPISNTPSKDNNPDGFEKIILKVRMRCHFDKMAKVLFDIENNSPHLFVDNLQMEQRIISNSRRDVAPVKPMLEVRFDLYAYMNNPVRQAER